MLDRARARTFDKVAIKSTITSMSRSIAGHLLLIVIVWAAIFLPWLGTPELRSEEGRRVLPALEMLDSGNYLVPHIGGEAYLRKPPLINWLLAAAFKISGGRNEWAARLPSALAVLAAAMALLIGGRGLLGNRGAAIAALAWLTNLGVMEKGRMIEIDAIYVSLFAIAFVCWIVGWQHGRSVWFTWIVPWIVLGLATLAKGPAHLVFFYAIVVAVLWRTQRLTDLRQPAHVVGVVLLVAIFAAWAVPCILAVHHNDVARTWAQELAMRISGGENDATEWPMNFPRGLGYFLPWLFLLPFIRVSKISTEHEQRIASALLIGAAVPFVITLLLPGTIPRYILPTIVPVCWVISIAVRDEAYSWRILPRRVVWGAIATFALVAAIAFPVRSATFLKSRPKVRPIAEKVNAVVPAGEPLYAVNPLFQPYLFYVHAPVRYLHTVDELPAAAHFFIVGPTEKDRVENSARFRDSRPQLLLTTPDYRGHSTWLFRIGAQ
jgi:4-amino-4-deoxy-L-arabinose transferase-like glycosyltransferase